MGVGVGLALLNINVGLLSLVPAYKRGKAIGMLTSSYFFGQFFSPILCEPIVAEVGVQGLFFIISLGCLAIAGGIYIFTVIKKASKAKV